MFARYIEKFTSNSTFMHKDYDMENMSRWKIIKTGFLLGIGFIVPLICVILAGTIVSVMAIPPVMEQAFDDESGGMLSDLKSDEDDLKRIKILNFREQPNGNRLLILGSIENISEDKASSIQLEAELTNLNGEFVYECSEYISKNLMPGEKENFQIRCGCGDTPMPKYSDLSVRVVSISNY